ncbi:MAG: patatin-like phospholipase family protein [Pseudomonadales bacterium]
MSTLFRQSDNNTPKTALIMPGGGARAAYQVGVLKALAQVTNNNVDNPFPILCGTSAGAINAVALASREENFQQSCQWLEELWMELQTEHVYRSDWTGMIRNTWRLFLSLVNSGIAVGRPVALLDNLPLKQMLREKIDFSGISRNLQTQKLSAVCVTAMNYTEGVSVSFYQGGPESADWLRWRRQGIPTPLQLRHILASTAIPTIFPPQRIGRNYYGDGALRQLTPISPALHLGAEKILIISTTGHKREYDKPYRRIHSPAFGQIIGHLLNSAFVDSLETDIELLEKINELLKLTGAETKNPEGRSIQPIDIQVISPSEDIDSLAEEYAAGLPASIRALLKITGGSSSDGGVNIASYLLFTRDFCQRLIDLGYKDGHDQAEEVMTLFR